MPRPFSFLRLRQFDISATISNTPRKRSGFRAAERVLGWNPYPVAGWTRKHFKLKVKQITT